MKDMREELEKILAGCDDEVEVFDPLEACPMEELFCDSHDDIVVDLIFSAGIMEAVKRLLRKHDDYGLIKMVRTILDVEVEKDE